MCLTIELYCAPGMTGIARSLFHAFFWPRVRYNRAIKRFASTVPPGSRVLEFGSGKEVNGRYTYSAARYFPHCDFFMTDIVPDFGHPVVDITAPGFDSEFDVAIASSVLEHVYDFDAAVVGLLKVLRPGGVARIRVPFIFPLHDEPYDYWRFTEHALRKMLSSFSSVSIEAEGARRAPFGYTARAVK